MLYRSMLLGVLLAGLCASGQAAPPAKSMLDGVPELQRPVTFAEPKIPLGELLRRVAKETGASVYADRTTADEPAAVTVTEMPPGPSHAGRPGQRHLFRCRPATGPDPP